MGQARSVENEDPLVDLRAFYFSEGSPPHCQENRNNRVHFRLEYGQIVHDDGEESFGLFKLKFSLFSFEGKGERI